MAEGWLDRVLGGAEEKLDQTKSGAVATETAAFLRERTELLSASGS
jgi:hypothetical protein